ncbi:MAG: hypothetical protein GY711_20950 [bacterium]|nr:hypothetical protein [bacterium]
MRSVLVESARARTAEKRGGGRPVAELTEEDVSIDEPEIDLLALDEALGRLEERDPRLARLVEMRFFAGLSHQQCADALEQSLRTVERNWNVARVWLRGQLAED